MLTYYTIDVNKDRKSVNGWLDITKKVSCSDDMIMEKDVAVSFAQKYHDEHENDDVRVLEHTESVIHRW